MGLLVRKPLLHAYTPIVIPGESSAQLIEFGLLALNKGEDYCFNTAGKEWVGVILGGQCDILGDEFGWKHAGEREDVFRGKATAFYLPPSHECKITARTDLSVGLAAAATDIRSEPVFIEPDNVRTRMVGKENFRRQVHDVFDNTHLAGRLIVGETFNPPGNWSSYPPHRHEADNPPEESRLEEVYFFKFSPEQGFGYQQVYTDDGQINELHCVRDGDTVIIPRGYHPVVAAPGYQLYYLWILAGETRRLQPHDDPDHQWINSSG